MPTSVNLGRDDLDLLTTALTRLVWQYDQLAKVRKQDTLSELYRRDTRRQADHARALLARLDRLWD